MLRSPWQDVRCGARLLRRSPIFTSAAVVSIAGSLAAGTGIAPMSVATAPSGSTAGSGPASRVWLDHVYIVLDSETHAAVVASTLLTSAFAAVQVRTTTSGERTWTGAYVQGRHTYVELFPPTAGFGGVGHSGIAFSAEVQGTADSLKAALTKAGATPTLQFRTGLRDGKQEPWFHSLRSWSDTTPAIARWLMEYDPAFLRWEGTDSVLSDNRVFRRRLPRRRHDATLPLLDVVGLIVTLPAWDAERLKTELVTYGWVVAPSRTATPGFTATGPDVRLEVRVGTAEPGISTIMFSVKASPQNASDVSLGSSTLRLAPDRAVWTFSRR